MIRKKKEQVVDNTQTGNDQTLIETSHQDLPESFIEGAKKALEEVDAGEVTPYVKRTPPEPSVIASEEESEDLDTKVLETGEIAQNTFERVLEEGIDYHQSGLDGAEVKVSEDYITITTLEGESKDFLYPDDSGVKHFVLNSVGQPLPATLVTIREMRIDNLVDKVLYVASLGGEVYPRGISINRAPYRTSVLIPTAKLEDYNTLAGKLQYSEEDAYLDLVVRGSNGASFLKRLIEVGRKGVVMTPKKTVRRMNGYAVALKCKLPVIKNAYTSVGLDKPHYTFDELKVMKVDSLKIICDWYRLEWRGSSQARLDIISHQKKLKVNS